MIDRVTGISMYVADNRVEEYLAAGHKLAADKPEADEEKPKRKRTTKK
jgi:hypothetical protein